MENESLKDKIRKEMLADHEGVLSKNFELAKRLIRVTPTGKVEIHSKEKLTGKEQIILYLVGKHYAKQAGLSQTEYVRNKELIEELEKPEGSIFPWIKELLDTNKIRRIGPGNHTISLNMVEKSLTEINAKIGGLSK